MCVCVGVRACMRVRVNACAHVHTLASFCEGVKKKSEQETHERVWLRETILMLTYRCCHSDSVRSLRRAEEVETREIALASSHTLLIFLL